MLAAVIWGHRGRKQGKSEQRQDEREENDREGQKDNRISMQTWSYDQLNIIASNVAWQAVDKEENNEHHNRQTDHIQDWMPSCLVAAVIMDPSRMARSQRISKTRQV